MPTLTSKAGTGAYILTEASGLRSRDAVKYASGSGVIEPGTVLGKVTASGKFMPHAPAAADGTQTAVAICYARVDATAADADGVATTRDSEVIEAELVLNAATDTAPEKAAVYAALAANGIIVRASA